MRANLTNGHNFGGKEGNLIELVRKMLTVDPTKRPRAEDLMKSLENLTN